MVYVVCGTSRLDTWYFVILDILFLGTSI